MVVDIINYGSKHIFQFSNNNVSIYFAYIIQEIIS